MPRVGLVLGQRIGPFPGRLDAALLRDFSLATKEPARPGEKQAAVAPLAIVTQLWEAQQQSRAALVPLDFQRAAAGGVHGEHDVVLHRPLVAGELLHTWVEGIGARTVGRNALVTLRYATFDDDGALVAEQWWTTVWLGLNCADSGEPTPDHRFPDSARDWPIGTWQVAIDDQMARRYAQVSGDWSPHHFDVAAARRSGADGVFLHGLCTMALCGRAMTDLVAGGDPERIRRVAVRFAQPLLLGEQLDVVIFDAGPLGYAFEGRSRGTEVITNGRAELW